MADLVNPTHKERLSVKNQEPSHISGKAPYEVLGGPGVSSQPGGDDYKLDVTKGINTDTTIPKSVGAEPSHLKTEGDETPQDDVTVDFGEEDEVPVDDIDTELDEFEDIPPADVDVEVSDDDELKKEEFGADDKKDEKEKVDEEDESEKEDDKKDELTEEDDNPFKDDEKKDDEKKLDEEDDEEKKDDEEICESLRIRLHMPSTMLFESVGIPSKAQKKFGVILESVVKDISKQVAAQTHAHFKKLHEQKLAKRDAVLTKQVDAYLSYVVEEWVKQNRVPIRTSLRTQLSEEFLTALQRLFKEHYIDVPESKVNVVNKLAAQVEKLKGALNEQVEQKMKLRKLAEAANKARIVTEMSSGLSAEQKAKLKKLAENTEYTSAKEFRGKVALLKENYFAGSKEKKLKTLPEGEVIQEEKKVATDKTASSDPLVSAIADTLSQVAQRDKSW